MNPIRTSRSQADRQSLDKGRPSLGNTPRSTAAAEAAKKLGFTPQASPATTPAGTPAASPSSRAPRPTSAGRSRAESPVTGTAKHAASGPRPSSAPRNRTASSSAPTATGKAPTHTSTHPAPSATAPPSKARATTRDQFTVPQRASGTATAGAKPARGGTIQVQSRFRNTDSSARGAGALAGASSLYQSTKQGRAAASVVRNPSHPAPAIGRTSSLPAKSAARGAGAAVSEEETRRASDGGAPTPAATLPSPSAGAFHRDSGGSDDLAPAEAVLGRARAAEVAAAALLSQGHTEQRQRQGTSVPPAAPQGPEAVSTKPKPTTVTSTARRGTGRAPASQPLPDSAALTEDELRLKLQVMKTRLLQWQYMNAALDRTTAAQAKAAERELAGGAEVVAGLRAEAAGAKARVHALRSAAAVDAQLQTLQPLLADWALRSHSTSANAADVMEALEAVRMHMPLGAGMDANPMQLKSALEAAAAAAGAAVGALEPLHGPASRAATLASSLQALAGDEARALHRCAGLLDHLSYLEMEQCSLRAHEEQKRNDLDPNDPRGALAALGF